MWILCICHVSLLNLLMIVIGSDVGYLTSRTTKSLLCGFLTRSHKASSSFLLIEIIRKSQYFNALLPLLDSNRYIWYMIKLGNIFSLSLCILVLPYFVYCTCM